MFGRWKDSCPSAPFAKIFGTRLANGNGWRPSFPSDQTPSSPTAFARRAEKRITATSSRTVDFRGHPAGKVLAGPKDHCGFGSRTGAARELSRARHQGREERRTVNGLDQDAL